MFVEYFHNCPQSSEAGKAHATKGNGTTLQFATSEQAAAEGARIRELPYTLQAGRLSHAIVTDDRGFREIFACAGQSAELAQAVADSDFDCDVL
jgi:hypothetical protein